jgi:hypothetical protein
MTICTLAQAGKGMKVAGGEVLVAASGGAWRERATAW